MTVTKFERLTICAAAVAGALAMAACGVTPDATEGPEVGTFAGGGFAASCDHVTVTNQCNYNSYCNLGAWCRRTDGSINQGAWWNLDNTIGNFNGGLKTLGNGFSQTCEQIYTRPGINGDPWLHGYCRRNDNTYNEDNFVLDNCLTNWNGELHWTCN